MVKSDDFVGSFHSSFFLKSRIFSLDFFLCLKKEIYCNLRFAPLFIALSKYLF